MNTGFNNNTFQLYMRYKRKDLKWYQKLWNYITWHKERNWQWAPINNTLEKIGDN